MITPDFAGIPGFLTEQDRWLMWREVKRSGKGKPTKVPFMTNGKTADATDPGTWTSFTAASSAAASFHGIGFALGELGTGTKPKAWGIDLDSCIDPLGRLYPWAEPIVAALIEFRVYIELSPGEEGLKAIFLTSSADAAEMRPALGIDADKWGNRRSVVGAGNGKEHGPAIETYLDQRYFTVTGHRWEGAGTDIVWLERDALDELARLIALAVGTPGPGKRKGASGQRTSRDSSRSAAAWAIGNEARARGASYEEMCEAIRTHPETAAWYVEKGLKYGERELKRIWNRAGWMSLCQVNDKGKPGPTFVNVMVALRHAPELQHLLAYDEMVRMVTVTGTIPGASGKPSTILRDVDTSAVQEWMQKAGLMVPADIVRQGIHVRAHERAFHPVQDYLNGLHWDGIGRLHNWLHTYLGAVDTPYTACVGRLFLTGMVARILQPGCQSDYMLVLEGLQGILKSRACRALASPWFSDALPDLRGDAVRVSMHLRGKWLVEVSELSAMSKADTAELKAFLTRPEERFVPKYGHAEVIEPRQCMFIGTTNKPTWMRDETGGRRFWPVEALRILLDDLVRDRDQLFAESVACYRKGEPWWPDPEFERKYIKPEQDARFEADAWEDAIATFLVGRNQTTIPEIVDRVLYLSLSKTDTAMMRRIAAILVKQEWEFHRTRAQGRFWAPRQ